jgi:hypothetical protein
LWEGTHPSAERLTKYVGRTSAGQNRFVFYSVASLVVGLFAALALPRLAALVVVGAVLGAVWWSVAALTGEFDALERGPFAGALLVAMLICSWSVGVVVGGLIRRLIGVYRALILLAALVGFCVGFVVRFLIGIEETAAPECDGPCFERWDEVLWVSGWIGVAAAIVFGVVAWGVLRRYFANPS